MELDFSGLFKKTPVENAMERKRLHKVAESIDVLGITVIVVAAIIVVGALMGHLLWTIPFVSVALIVSNFHMYNAAYRDGFRSGYLTAVDDHNEFGFVPERLE